MYVDVVGGLDRTRRSLDPGLLARVHSWWQPAATRRPEA